jgi:ribonucleoside-diphosphate reductase alpha chain
MMELPRETLDWFEGDELRARVFFEKYALQDLDGTPLELTPEEMWERIAKVLSELEETEEKRREWYEKFRWLLSNFRFIPGGRIMHAVGNPRKVTPFNCFVLPIKDDSLEAIFECAKEMARTYSQGGGVGIDISVLRPAGSPVRNAARTSTGAVSFMELYSMVTGTIGQHGRRGALMITIADNHPDVLAFIDIKNDPERRRVRYANISVRVSDELMEAVQRNGKFELRFDGEYFSIRRTVDAREIWDKLIQNAWSSAEPGCLFWSTIKRYSTSEYNGMEVISTNPCVTGDTLVSTDEGLIPIAELAKRNRLPHAILDSRVSPHFHTGAIIKAWWSGRKPVYRVVTRAGYEVRATADHKILTANRGWVQVKDLQPGDLLLIQNRKGGFGRYGDEHLGRILGWLVADGHVNHHDNRAVLDLDAQDRELAPAFAQSVASAIPTSQRYPAPSVVAVPSQERVQIRSRRLLEKLVELGFDPAEKHTIPAVVWQGSEAMVRGFLQALFTADGTVQSSSGSRFSVRLTSTNLRFLKDVQILLAHFGIASRIYENRRPEGAKLMPDGRGGVKLYGTQPVHELVIGRENIARFYREIGFLPGSEKQKKLEQIVKSYERGPYRETFTTPVVEVIPEGVEDVYDLTEAVSHTFIANGLTVANCGEEPLPAYGNCNLGNINLSAFVLDEFTDAARVDWESLEKAVRYAVRFLDNVITYAVKEDRLPLPQQKERCAAERRIGVGFTGLGDMLAQLRLKYDTDDALEFVDELFHKIKCWAYDESINLAIERGPFPLFDPEKHLQMGFIRERLPRELQEKIRRHGIRNVCVLTVPPVGSGAAMAGVTSGIEPIFALSYIRRSESLSKGEFKVFHPCVRRYMEKFDIDDERDLPDFFVTAHQIIPEMRVRMQAIIQSHIDQSISSTINLPHDITTQEVERIYFLAWKLGCKGITVYREGSREGVLITEEFAQQKRGRLMPKPRPMVLVGKTYKLRTEMGNVYVTVNADEEGPQEVFVRLGKSGSSAMAFTEAIGRLISLALRAGVSPDAIIDQLSGIKSSSATRQENGTIIFSVPDAVAKALEMFLKGENPPKSSALTEVLLQALTENNETELAVPPISSIREELPQILQANGARYSGDLCPNCGEPLIHSGGCELCLFCGYSRCQ